MENNKKDKLIDLRKRENIEKNDGEPVFVRKMDASFLKKQKKDQAENSLESVPSFEEKIMDKVKKVGKFSNSVSTDIDSSNENEKEKKISNLLDGGIKWLLYILVFLLPIFALPFTVEVFEFNKTVLLFVISSLAFFLLAVKMILVQKRISILKTPLDIPIVIFMFVVIISTIYSVDKTSSLLGFYGRFSDSLMVYLSLGMLYFTMINLILPRSGKPNHFARNIFRLFLFSSLIIVLGNVFYSLSLLLAPSVEFKSSLFNFVGGSLNVLVIYLVPVIIIALSFLKSSKAVTKYILSLLILLSLIIFVLADFMLGWIALLISLFIIVFFSYFQKEKQDGQKSSSNAGAVMIMIISVLFVVSSLSVFNSDEKKSEPNFTSSVISDFFRGKILGDENSEIRKGFNKELIAEKKTVMSVATESLKTRPILGSGPGTYLYNFSKFRPAEFNDNIFWNIRFDKAGNEILEKFSTIGLAGVFSYLLIIFLTVLIFLKSFSRKNGAEPVNLYTFAAWFALLFIQFMYLESTATKFVFWLLTILIVVNYFSSQREQNEYRVLDLKVKKEETAYFMLATILLIFAISLIVSYFYQSRFYKADMAYKNALMGQNQSVDNLENIVKLNPYRGEYEIYLSNVALGKLVSHVQDQNSGIESEDGMQKIALEAKNTIDHVKKAVELGPNSASFYQRFASLYAILNKDLNIEKADEWAITGYQKAIELEPTNPVLYTELGKIYMLQSYRLEQSDKTDQAIREFEKAVELKNNYADAIFELALAYETQEEFEKAINAISLLGNIGNISVDTAFQFGRIYYNSGDIEEAKKIFLEIIKVEPNNSNTHYSLGLIYERENDIQNALNEFEIVLSLNPENKDVANKIDALKKFIKSEVSKSEPELEGAESDGVAEDEEIQE
ncbi:MAG: tetratricopeptide repeat protein [Candidatus Pacebacteria bacterium]|nr:tetratricopeptide repeat protein [Candidatus Paceibacterota bacterium]